MNRRFIVQLVLVSNRIFPNADPSIHGLGYLHIPHRKNLVNKKGDRPLFCFFGIFAVLNRLF